VAVSEIETARHLIGRIVDARSERPPGAHGCGRGNPRQSSLRVVLDRGLVHATCGSHRRAATKEVERWEAQKDDDRIRSHMRKLAGPGSFTGWRKALVQSPGAPLGRPEGKDQTRTRGVGLEGVRRSLLLFLISAGLLLSGCADSGSGTRSGAGPTLEPGDSAPHFSLSTSTGASLSLSDLRGNPALFYFSMGPG
jgi:hypothetical protein